MNITPISLEFMVHIPNYLMGVINQLITGGHHLVLTSFKFVFPECVACRGSRFTLGLWGLRVCSLDVAFTVATVRNRSRAVA